MPLTIQFGSWAPDQADTPIQIPDQQGPVPVPCADVLNVIYVNGNYESIKSPSNGTIGVNAVQPISVSPVNAFSYLDGVDRQQTIFVGTGTGIQQLNPDGSWSNVNLFTSQIISLIGQSMSFVAGHFLNSTSLLGARLGFTTGAIIATETSTSFVAGTQTVHGDETYYGYIKSGFPTIGTLVKDQIGLFAVWDFLVSSVHSKNSALQLSITPDPGINFFTTAIANGVSQLAAAANYTYSPGTPGILGVASWVWPNTVFGFAPGSTYTVSIV